MDARLLYFSLVKEHPVRVGPKEHPVGGGRSFTRLQYICCLMVPPSCMSVRERGAVLICTELRIPPLVLRGFRKRSTFVLSDSSARGYIPSSVVGQG